MQDVYWIAQSEVLLLSTSLRRAGKERCNVMRTGCASIANQHLSNHATNDDRDRNKAPWSHWIDRAGNGPKAADRVVLSWNHRRWEASVPGSCAHSLGLWRKEVPEGTTALRRNAAACFGPRSRPRSPRLKLCQAITTIVAWRNALIT